MTTHVPGAHIQSSTDQDLQISGSTSETSASRHADLNLGIPNPIPNYNPYMLLQQVGAQSYPTYPLIDSQQPQYDQQDYVPSSIHRGSLYTTLQELDHRYQEYRPPVQEQMLGFTELQQHNYMQQAEGYVQSSQTGFETRHQGQMQRFLPRRLPHMRQRIRRPNRINRAHITHIHSVAADMVYNNRERSTATSITGSMTSGPVVQTPVEIEGSQERLTRLTSATATEESSGIGENFECNICFQKANEAVVTCCGHLFCWPCLYRWLHVHSYHKECPVCKGAIAEYSITPIYGRENSLAPARLQGVLGSERIPPRPAARRIETVRQQRERLEREREGELREAEASESTNQVREFEQVGTEIEEGEPRGPGAEAPTSEATLQTGEDNPQEGEEAATRLQDMEHDGWEAGEPTEHSQSGYLRRRLTYRRGQLRQALVNSRYNSALNQIPEARNIERQQMLAASALLSQEWEQIINGSRPTEDPTQAATWLASMHARLANMEGNVEFNFNIEQQRRQMIASAVSQLSQQPQEDSISRLTVHSSQVSDWLTIMRTRLNDIEQIMQNLDHPIEGNRMSQSTITPDVGNPNSLQLDDTIDMNPGAFLAELNATAIPQEIASGSEQYSNLDAAQNFPEANESGPERIAAEAQIVRSRRREHGEEASHIVSQEERAEAQDEDQLPLTHKQRRRLD